MAHNLWLALCVFVSCYFYGANLNPLLVLPGLLGPLVVLATTPGTRILQLHKEAPLVLWGSVAALVLIAAHQLLASISPGTSFIPSVVFACLPLWVLTVAVLKNPRQLWVFVVILISCFAALSVFEFLLYQQRAHAPLVDPGNYLALLYLAWIPWLIAALVKPVRGSSLWLLFAFAALFTIAMLATHLRFAWLVLVLMIVVIVWVCLRLKQWRTGLTATGAMAAASVLYLLLDPSGAASSFDSGGGTGIHGSDGSAQSPRLLLWQAAWEAVKAMGGVNGTGMGTFIQVYPIFRSPAEQSTAGVLVHNDLLQLLLEGGVWLFAPMLLMCVAIGLATFLQLFLQRVPRREAGLFLALSVAVVHATVNFVFYVLPLVIVFAMALTMALVVYPREGSSPAGALAGTTAPHRGWLIGKLVAITLLLVNVGYVVLDVTNLGVFAGYKQAPGASYLSAEPQRTLAFARLSQTLNTRRGLPVFGEARLLEQKLAENPTPLNLSQAEAAYRRSVQVDGLNTAVLVNYAMFKQSLKQEQAQRELLERALKAKPYDFYASSALLQFHMQRGEQEQAQHTARHILQWCKLMRAEPGAQPLFEYVENVLAPSVDESARVQWCIQEIHRLKGSGRKQTRLMRWAAGKS